MPPRARYFHSRCCAGGAIVEQIALEMHRRPRRRASRVLARARTARKIFQKSVQLENNDKLKHPRPDGNPRQARIYTVIIKIYERTVQMEKNLTMMNRATRWEIRFADTIYYHAISHDN